jgi:hypothetical protein
MKLGFKRYIVVGICLISSYASYAANGNGIATFYGNTPIQQQSTDPTKPVPRGYLVPTVTPINGGAKIAVDLYFTALNSGVSLYLQAAINDGTGAVQAIPLKTLSDKVSDNPKLFHSRREFNVSYAELNAELAKLAPNAHMEIGPGTPLFVYGRWDVGHQWGGIDRGGIIFMPDDGSGTEQQASTANSRRPTELDIAYPINDVLGNQFNTNGKGLKVGGQVRSRLESEGKFQIPDDSYDQVKKSLFELARDPSKATAILGSEWTITLQDRYMKKDAQGKILLDSEGFPTPDPMVDTYYDNDNYDAAKHDVAIRYRFTENNGFGDWELKPGIGKVSANGIVTRPEYGFDATDDKPDTIKKFVDSMDTINPFRLVRDVIPGATPSQFLKPSVKLTDTRFKFILKHRNGLAIEVSLDNVNAESLRNGAKGNYKQLEMDVEHLSIASNNVASSVNTMNYSMQSDPAQSKQWLDGLGAKAFLDGRPVLHDLRDLDPASPVRAAHAADFTLAGQAVDAIRNHVIGRDWIPGAQKYAFSSYKLDLVNQNEISPSVKAAVAGLEKERLSGSTVPADTSAASGSASGSAAGGALCATVFQ